MSKRILVVDDDDRVHQLLAAYFRQDQVDHAHNGFEALDLLHGNTYDFVIVDEQMPGMTGSELLRRLEGKSPPAIGISADDLLLDHLRCAGCVATLLKPLFFADLQEAVDRAVAARQPTDFSSDTTTAA